MFRQSLTLFALAAVAACSGGNDETAMPIKAFMANEVQPTAEIYWNAVQFVSDETGDHDIQPETDADWQTVTDAAAKLAEHGKTLKQPAYAEDRGQGWIDFADGLIEIAGKAEEAAKSKNPDAVFEVGGTVYNVCSACHQAYPPETPVEGATPA